MRNSFLPSSIQEEEEDKKLPAKQEETMIKITNRNNDEEEDNFPDYVYDDEDNNNNNNKKDGSHCYYIEDDEDMSYISFPLLRQKSYRQLPYTIPPPSEIQERETPRRWRINHHPICNTSSSDCVNVVRGITDDKSSSSQNLIFFLMEQERALARYRNPSSHQARATTSNKEATIAAYDAIGTTSTTSLNHDQQKRPERSSIMAPKIGGILQSGQLSRSPEGDNDDGVPSGAISAMIEAVLDGRITVSCCALCGVHLYCVETMELVRCTICNTVSPVDQSRCGPTNSRSGGHDNSSNNPAMLLTAGARARAVAPHADYLPSHDKTRSQPPTTGTTSISPSATTTITGLGFSSVMIRKLMKDHHHHANYL